MRRADLFNNGLFCCSVAQVQELSSADVLTEYHLSSLDGASRDPGDRVPLPAIEAISVKSHTISLVLPPAFGVTPAVTWPGCASVVAP